MQKIVEQLRELFNRLWLYPDRRNMEPLCRIHGIQVAGVAGAEVLGRMANKGRGTMTSQSAATRELRLCLRQPIPEIEQAARLLDAAASAHHDGRRDVAEELLRTADDKRVWDWLDSVWGKRSPYTQFQATPNAPLILAKEHRIRQRNPGTLERQQIHERDGYYCRFCGIPVIRSEIRKKFRQAYPDAVHWGNTNDRQHAAFQAMWAQYDHVLPHARGGTNDISNVVLTCAACNYGRMSYTIEEVGLIDPRTRDPRRGPWDGLERFRP